MDRTDDCPALVVVVLKTELHDVLLSCNVELLVDLVFDGETVGVPSEASVDVVAGSVGVSGDDVLEMITRKKVSTSEKSEVEQMGQLSQK